MLCKIYHVRGTTTAEECAFVIAISQNERTTFDTHVIASWHTGKSFRQGGYSRPHKTNDAQ